MGARPRRLGLPLIRYPLGAGRSPLVSQLPTLRLPPGKFLRFGDVAQPEILDVRTYGRCLAHGRPMDGNGPRLVVLGDITGGRYVSNVNREFLDKPPRRSRS
jgi:hypothetical protein